MASTATDQTADPLLSTQRFKDADRAQLLAAIAEGYYIDGLSQAEIADKFGCNRSAVSRYLTAAREAGIVEIKIHREFSPDARLGEALSRKSRSTTVHVLRTNGLAADAAKSIVARYAARLIHARLSDATVLAITLGSTVHAVAQALSFLPPAPIEVVQMCGSVGASEPNFDGHATVHLLSAAYRCGATYLHAPFLVETRQVRESLLRSPGNAQCTNRCRAATIAVVGLGTMDTAASALARGGLVRADVIADLARRGAVGDVGGYTIDENGALLSAPDYLPVLAMTLGEFASVPARFGAAVGRQKAGIIAAALRGGVLTDLVTESDTAEAVAAVL